MAARSKKTKPAVSRSRSTSKGASGGFPCPDCSFVAKHPMGLGRHRSTRHGAVSQRKQRQDSGGSWLTRHEAARRAGVHYNTIRQWEQAELLRKTKRPRVRGSLVSADDLARLLAERASATGGVVLPVDASAALALERRYRELIESLELLLAQAKASAPAPSGGSKTIKTRKAKSGTTKAKPKPKSTAKQKAKPKKANGSSSRGRR